MIGERVFVSVLCAVALSLIAYGGEARGAAAPQLASCAGCHRDFKSVLPRDHAAVSGKDIRACFACHAPSTRTGANTFSARLHRAHLKAQARTDCVVCRSWAPGKSFGLPGQKISWGSPARESMDLIRKSAESWAG
ncbi:MAG TPA: hypothetical protein VLS90_04880, partial [Thermodesulfobacteriota bacterium]|nr:hypothetical protein [Thermodesulfobacteriota bacterium]